MQTSHKIFSIGFILFLGVLICTLVFQGQSIRKNKNAYKSNEKKVLKRMPNFKPMEVQSLPNFRHVVVDLPRHFVAINQSNGFSGLKLKSKIDEIGLEDFVETSMHGDTLFLTGKIDLLNFQYAEPGKPLQNFEEAEKGAIVTDNAIRLSVQGPNIETITLMPKAKAEVMMQFANYPDSNWLIRTVKKIELEQDSFKKGQLTLNIHKEAICLAYLDADNLDLQYVSGTSMGSLSMFLGKIGTMKMMDPAGRFSFSNGIVVDSVYLEGTAMTSDPLDLRIRDYLYTDLVSAQGFHVKYYADSQPITLEGHTDKYQLITRKN